MLLTAKTAWFCGIPPSELCAMDLEAIAFNEACAMILEAWVFGQIAAMFGGGKTMRKGLPDA